MIASPAYYGLSIYFGRPYDHITSINLEFAFDLVAGIWLYLILCLFYGHIAQLGFVARDISFSSSWLIIHFINNLRILSSKFYTRAFEGGSPNME